MNEFKIKQKKTLLEKMINTTFVVFVMLVSVYLYQNVKVVFNIVLYKNSINNLAKIEKELSLVDGNISSYKNFVSVGANTGEYKTELIKNKEAKLYVSRNDNFKNFTYLYGIR